MPSESAILITAKAAYRSFSKLSHDEKVAVLEILTECLPSPADEIAGAQLYHLRCGDKAQLQLESIICQLPQDHV
ncbi:hypothetical protein [Opitutus sp. ER46]|uniref:hypothetical protein n=1 Tax=Opitutus sp. ER46 TaxID=2161864 RepID=UPI000D30E914|nr:hypothetical protein [Opitutus sp. ER46]PTX95749.1 hypothetical protein DB354_10080 [Opitutus sp. ER46]